MAKQWIPIAWTLIMAFLLFMPGCMIPQEKTFVIPQFDKVVHLGMFGGFVFLWNLYLSNRDIPSKGLLRLLFIIFALGVCYGIGSEFVQKYWVPGRDYDNADIIADMIGASLGYGISNLSLLPA